MFDRIAGVYDLMNTAMTAGLHRHWRERAAELARVGPGELACSTWPPAPAIWRSSWRAASRREERWSAAISRRACWRGPAPRPRLADGALVQPRFEWGDALELPYEDDLFDAADGGVRRTQLRRPSPRSAELARVVRPGGRVVVLEITTPTRAPLSLFYRTVVRPRRARPREARGLARGARSHGCGDRPRRQRSPARTPTCPTPSSAFRRPPCWRRRWSGRASTTSATCSRPEASSPSTRAPFRRGRA